LELTKSESVLIIAKPYHNMICLFGPEMDSLKTEWFKFQEVFLMDLYCWR